MSGTLKALKCYVELDICSVACQQVRLCHGGDVYLRISFLGQVATTHAVRPVFPLEFNEKFHFAKVFWAAYEPSQVSKALQCSHVSLRLLQTLPAIGNDILLASFESDAGTILYPAHQRSKTTSQHYYETSNNLRHLLLYRTEFFPGMNPQLKYKVRIVISDTAENYSSDCNAAFGVGKMCQCNKCWPIRGNPAWKDTGLVRKSRHKARRSPSDERGDHRRAQNSVRKFKQHDLPSSNQLQRNFRKRLSRSVPCQTQSKRYPQPIARPVQYTSSSVGQQPCTTRRRQSRSVPVRCRRSSSSVSPVLRPANRLWESSGSYSQCHCVRRPGSAARHAKCRQKNVEPNRPPFVVRRIDSKLFRRTPGLGSGSQTSQSRGRSENRRSVVKQTKLIEHARKGSCDSNGVSDVESLSSSGSDIVRYQDREETADDSDTLTDNDIELSDSCCESSTRSNCRVCEAYERYMGRPYCGHSRGHHVTSTRQSTNQTRLSADERIGLQPAHHRYVTRQPRSVRNTNHLDKTNSVRHVAGFQHSASDWLEYDARHQVSTADAGLLNSKLAARRAGTVEANLVNRQQANVESQRAKHQQRKVMTSYVSGSYDRKPVDRQYSDVSAADWREYREDSFVNTNHVSRLRDSYWSKDVSNRPCAVGQPTIPSIVNSETVCSDSVNSAIRQDIRRSLSNFYQVNAAPRPPEATHSVDKQRVLQMY